MSSIIDNEEIAEILYLSVEEYIEMTKQHSGYIDSTHTCVISFKNKDDILKLKDCFIEPRLLMRALNS